LVIPQVAANELLHLSAARTHLYKHRKIKSMADEKNQPKKPKPQDDDVLG
jgi:hypothetical protein